MTLTATALDSFGNPVARLPVSAGHHGRRTRRRSRSSPAPTGRRRSPTTGRTWGADTATVDGDHQRADPDGHRSRPSSGRRRSGTPCTGRATPLDVMLVIDASPSMFADDQVDAANAATDAFISDLSYPLDQIGTIVLQRRRAGWPPS